jgi:hypothetical protein
MHKCIWTNGDPHLGLAHSMHLLACSSRVHLLAGEPVSIGLAPFSPTLNQIHFKDYFVFGILCSGLSKISTCIESPLDWIK